jgi:hypothetical protein
MWNDCEDGILSIWSDIACGLENRFAPHPSPPIASLPGGIDQYLQADSLDVFLQHSDGALPSLNELNHLATVPGPFTTFPPSYLVDTAAFPWAHPESPGLGSLRVGPSRTFDTGFLIVFCTACVAGHEYLVPVAERCPFFEL